MHGRPEDFDYVLHPERIARHPAEPRDSARLMVLRRDRQGLEHRVVRELPDLLEPGDLLVANDAKVVPARVRARRESGGIVEVVLVRPRPDGLWQALVRSRGRVKVGDRLTVGEATLAVEGREGMDFLLRIEGMLPAELMRLHGEVPLPPYLDRPAEPDDRERYQTVFARAEGAVAAPTAGLHFTSGLMQALGSRGIAWATLSLIVGPGTFRSDGGPPDPERYDIPERTIQAIQRSRRVVAIGTTSARALETWASTGKTEGWTDLLITPGSTFRAVGALMTNFHLPRTSLLALVAAFAGKDRVMAAYAEAAREGYRFYSYGDAMLVT